MSKLSPAHPAPPPSNPLTIAIIGAGLVTQTIHLSTLLNLQSYFNVLFVCDLSLSLACQVALKYHIPRYTSNPHGYSKIPS
jgi:hypothetical protein